MQHPAPPSAPAPAPAISGARAADLREIIEQYNAVTERLQHSHEALQEEVARLQRELASTNAQLQRSKRLSALGEMAAGIAHEIRNPLAAIRLYAEMVGTDLDHLIVPLGGQDAVRDTPLWLASENNRKIADAVRGLSGIVDDVLSFARQAEPRVQRFGVSRLIQRVIDLHRPAIAAAGVEVVVDLRAHALTADPDLLGRALVNLVRNAVEAMAGTAARRTLTLTVAGDDAAGLETVTVADTGPGIADSEVDRIFNPFFTTRSTGTGLGLAIVHRIVDAHAGSIAVHNDPDTGGAVFTLTLPRSPLGSDNAEGRPAGTASPVGCGFKLRTSPEAA